MVTTNVPEVDEFALAENASYRSDYRRIIVNTLSTFKKLNTVRAIDMNSAVSAAMESSMDQTSEILKVSDDEVKELMLELNKRKNKTNKVLSQDMNLHRILKDKLGEFVIDDKMIESLLDTIASKFEKFQKAKNAMILTNNSQYLAIEKATIKEIDTKVGVIEEVNRTATDQYNMSWAKKLSNADDSISSALMKKLGSKKEKTMIAFHVLSVVGIIAIKRAFSGRKPKRIKR